VTGVQEVIQRELGRLGGRQGQSQEFSTGGPDSFWSRQAGCGPTTSSAPETLSSGTHPAAKSSFCGARRPSFSACRCLPINRVSLNGDFTTGLLAMAPSEDGFLDASGGCRGARACGRGRAAVAVNFDSSRRCVLLVGAMALIRSLVSSVTRYRPRPPPSRARLGQDARSGLGEGSQF